MFSGIITHLGRLGKVQKSIYTFSVLPSFCKHITKGISIAVNGVCLTVFQKAKNNFSIAIMPETARKTMLEKLKQKDLVNLELPASLSSFISGHLVQGHVDGVGKIEKIKREGNSRIMTISYPKAVGKYICPKGSIALNGVSLTVIDVTPAFFTVGIIPYTFSHTIFQNVTPGDLVNIEVDLIAKYVERLMRKE